MGPIAYLLGRFPTVSNTFVYREVVQLRAIGAEVQVYALSGSNDPDHAILEPGEVRRVPTASAVVRMKKPDADLRQLWGTHGGREKDLRRAGWLAARWSRDRVQAVHVHFLGTAAAVAAAACEIAQIPLVVSIHARGILVPDAMAGFTLGRAAEIRTISERTAALVAESSGRRSEVVPLAVSDAPIAPASPMPLHVLTVARPVSKKGYPVLRQAMSRLEGMVEWTVVGATECQIGGALPGLRALGARPFFEIEAVYASGVDVFVLPCQVAEDRDEDGVPVAMLEAMARGVPVVTTPVGGIPEVIEDGVNGRLVPPHNPVALAEVLRGLRDDPAERTRLGRAGRMLVRTTRQPEAQAETLRGLLQRAIDG